MFITLSLHSSISRSSTHFNHKIGDSIWPCRSLLSCLAWPSTIHLESMNMKLRSKRWRTSIWRFLWRWWWRESERERERKNFMISGIKLPVFSCSLIYWEQNTLILSYISLLSLQTAICFMRGEDIYIYSLCSRLKTPVTLQVKMARLNHCNVLCHFSHSGVDDMSEACP